MLTLNTFFSLLDCYNAFKTTATFVDTGVVFKKL